MSVGYSLVVRVGALEKGLAALMGKAQFSTFSAVSYSYLTM